MYLIDFELPAFILSVFCLLYCIIVKRRQFILKRSFKEILTNQHSMYMVMIISHIMSALSSVIGVHLQKIASPEIYPWQYFFHMLYYIFHATLSVSFTVYIMNVNGTSRGRKKVFYILFILPYILSEILILINPFTSLVFSMDAPNYLYERGPLMYLLYGFGVIYLLYGFVNFFKFKRAISRTDSYAVGFVVVLAAMGILVQAIFPKFLVELFAEAIAFLALLVLLEEKSGDMDPITGALNKRSFDNNNRKYIETNQKFTIILIGLTNLDLYSRVFSVTETNHLLLEISNFLSTIASEQHIYSYRYGSFALVAPNKTDAENEVKCDQLLERFSQTWSTKAGDILVDAAITCLNYPTDVTSIFEIEDIIDIDYRQHQMGSYIVSKDELYEHKRWINIEKALKNAIDEDRLMVYLQPIWSSVKQRTIAAEALIRVNDEILKNYSPEVYIPIAEKSGLIKEIGLYVFEEVCRFISKNDMKSLGIEYIELNLSIYQFIYEDLVTKLEEIRNRYHVDSSCINLEITESASLNEAPAVIETIRRLTEIGYKFSLDDFGTGYSNIVRTFQIEYRNVKIDKSILWSSNKTDDNGYRNLNYLYNIVKNIGSTIIQEGVETEEQLNTVLNLGCDLIQGFYFSKPISQSEFIE